VVAMITSLGIEDWQRRRSDTDTTSTTTTMVQQQGRGVARTVCNDLVGRNDLNLIKHSIALPLTLEHGVTVLFAKRLSKPV